MSKVRVARSNLLILGISIQGHWSRFRDVSVTSISCRGIDNTGTVECSKQVCFLVDKNAYISVQLILVYIYIYIAINRILDVSH